MRSLIPPALIGEPGWETLQALTRCLPFCVTDHLFGFEFDLCDASPAADFCVASPLGSRLAKFYGEQADIPLSDVISTDLGRFLREQARDQQSFLSRTGAGVILEYDLVGVPPGQRSVPGFFIVDASPSGSDKLRVHDDPEGLIATLLTAAGWGREAVSMSQMERVWAALGQKGVVAQAGAMPGRGQRAVRLVVQGVANEDICEVLERLQWPGDPALAVTSLLELAGLVRPRAALSIDVTSRGLSSRLGLELFRPTQHYRTDRAGWGSLIDQLEERQWCLSDKAKGMREWPRMEILMARGNIYRVRQFINHIKLVVDSGAVSAKAYVGCGVTTAA